MRVGGEGQLIRDAGKLKKIPGIIIPAATISPARRGPWDLHRAWPEAELHIVDGAGHAFPSRASCTS